jgi:Ca-activated chloride channel family protein
MRERMPVVHEAARGFMKVLRAGDRGAVVAFADNVRVIQDLTSDTTAIEAAINSTSARGATALHNAVYVSLKQFGRKAHSDGDVRRQAIAVLSDGEDTASLISLDDVLALARRMGVNIYTIGLRSDYRKNQQAVENLKFADSTFALRTLARETGAQSFFPANVHELKNVYDSIAQELEAQYSLAYSPSNTSNDGRFRRIVVRVPSHPSLRPRTRPGYTAASSSADVEMPAGVLR